MDKVCIIIVIIMSTVKPTMLPLKEITNNFVLRAAATLFSFVYLTNSITNRGSYAE